MNEINGAEMKRANLGNAEAVTMEREKGKGRHEI